MTTLRRGSKADKPIILALFDEAVAWMVARGQPDQWGTEPWSTNPQRIARVDGLLDDGDLWIAEVDGAPAGALIVGDGPQSYVPVIDEPERYVHLLITSRARAGLGIGSMMLDKAREIARADGVPLLRVDCWAGGGGKLVNYYVRNGFTPTQLLDVKGTPCQVFEQRLGAD